MSDHLQLYAPIAMVLRNTGAISMNDQRHSQSQHKVEPVLEKTKRHVPLGADQQLGGSHNPGQHIQGEQKGKTEQASQHGGVAAKTDHKQPNPITQK